MADIAALGRREGAYAFKISQQFIQAREDFLLNHMLLGEEVVEVYDTLHCGVYCNSADVFVHIKCLIVDLHYLGQNLATSKITNT